MSDMNKNVPNANVETVHDNTVRTGHAKNDVRTGHAMSLQNKNVPVLRFAEFKDSGDWEVKKLKTLAKKSTKKNKDETIKKVFTNSAIYGVIDQQEYFDKSIANKNNLSGYFIIEKNGFVYNPRCSVYAPVGPISKNKIGQGIMSPLYTVFRFNQEYDGFYEQYFKTSYWHGYLKSVSNTGARHDRMSISSNSFMDMPLPFPTLPEQQKIADCLSSLDEQINSESEQLTTLEIHKKGLMQQLFPNAVETGHTNKNVGIGHALSLQNKNIPACRFPEFKDSGEWEEISLINCSNFENKKIEIDSLNEGNYISTENLLANFEGVTSSKQLPNTRVTAFKVNDILISNIRPYLKKIWLASFDGGASNDVIVIRSNQKINHNFLLTILQNDKFISYVMNSAKGVKMPRGDIATIKKYLINLSSLPEQQKIADCLASLDDLITAQREKITALKLHKKGLMQGLFPSVA